MTAKESAVKSSKEVALIAVTCAMLIGGQLALSAVPGIEIVTVLLASFAAAFGVKRGVLLAVAFSLLRCLVFGFFPSVVILYMVYYPLFALVCALAAKGNRTSHSAVIALFAVVMTVGFSFLSGLIDHWMYGVDFWAYMAYGAWVTVVQTICAALSCFAFLPLLRKLFSNVKKSMNI